MRLAKEFVQNGLGRFHSSVPEGKREKIHEFAARLSKKLDSRAEEIAPVHLLDASVSALRALHSNRAGIAGQVSSLAGKSGDLYFHQIYKKLPQMVDEITGESSEFAHEFKELHAKLLQSHEQGKTQRLVFPRKPMQPRAPPKNKN